jgi:hypothetical protein
MNRIDRVNQLLGGGEAPFGVEDLVVSGEVSLRDAAAWVIDEALLELTTNLAIASGRWNGDVATQPGWGMEVAEAIGSAIERFVDEHGTLIETTIW